MVEYVRAKPAKGNVTRWYGKRPSKEMGTKSRSCSTRECSNAVSLLHASWCLAQLIPRRTCVQVSTIMSYDVMRPRIACCMLVCCAFAAFSCGLLYLTLSHGLNSVGGGGFLRSQRAGIAIPLVTLVSACKERFGTSGSTTRKQKNTVC